MSPTCGTGRTDMSTEGGTRAILAALAANLGIAVTKFVAYLLTQSSSMLAESIHSVADSGNQLLLLIGGGRAPRPPPPAPPLGDGGPRGVSPFPLSLLLVRPRRPLSLFQGGHHRP